VIHAGTTTGGTDGHAGFLIVPWHTAKCAPGQYRVRWTMQGEYREFPVEVKPAK
jgi:hypothetical protein